METEGMKPANPAVDGSTPALTVTITAEQTAMKEAQQAMLKRVGASGVVAYYTQFDAVLAFHAAALGRGISHIGEINVNPPEGVLTGRVKAIDEEVNNELMPLLRQVAENGGATLEQKVALLDHLIDSVYVLMGAAINLGLYFDTGFQIVHRANMAKVLTPIGPQFNEDGKVIKPEGWVAPDKALFEMSLEAFSEAEKNRPGKQNNLVQTAPANDIPVPTSDPDTVVTTPALDQSQPPIEPQS